MDFNNLTEYEKGQAAEALEVWWWVRRVAGALILLIALGMSGCPPYKVWQRTLTGKAELRQAEWNRQITIEAAKAKSIAAISLAEAEVARARGVAEANEIIAEGLGGPEGYLRYLWIQTLEGGTKDIIYIPTEANIPILEATRLNP